jgi:hypothetical protein
VAALALFYVAVIAFLHPVSALWLYLAVMPFLVGIQRGSALPLLRPNEALQFLLMAAVAARIALDLSAGNRRLPRLTGTDLSILVFAVAGSLLPLLVWTSRSGLPPLSEALSTFPVWRLAGLYFLVRFTVSEPSQLRIAWYITVSAAVLVAGITVAQVLALPGAREFLATFWTTTGAAGGRGTATLGSAHATGDLLAFSLALAIGAASREPGRSQRLFFGVAAVVLAVGTLGTAQFSGAIALVAVVAVLAALDVRVRRLLPFTVPLALLGGVLLWPALARRFLEFEERGLPLSWLTRWDNLSTFYLPRLADFGWLLGVRPDTVVVPPDMWRTEVFLEGGYLWLLWVGGIPLFLSFFTVIVLGVRSGLGATHRQEAPMAAAGLATIAALVVVLVLSILDPHITLRGAGDLLFVLLAASQVSGGARRAVGGSHRLLRVETTHEAIDP